MKHKLSELPGLNFSFSQPVELRFNELLTGVRADVAVKLYGEDLHELNRLGQQMVDIISRIPGTADVALERTDGLPQITVSYDASGWPATASTSRSSTPMSVRPSQAARRGWCSRVRNASTSW
jgi:Cu/Ag efflux pump CusA